MEVIGELFSAVVGVALGIGLGVGSFALGAGLWSRRSRRRMNRR